MGIEFQGQIESICSKVDEKSKKNYRVVYQVYKSLEIQFDLKFQKNNKKYSNSSLNRSKFYF